MCQMPRRPGAPIHRDDGVLRRVLSLYVAATALIAFSVIPAMAQEASGSPGATLAQTLPPGTGEALAPVRRGGPAPLLTPVQPKPPPTPSVTAPPPPPLEPPPAPLASAPRFLLRGVTLDGNTVLDSSAIDHIVAPYIGRAVTTSDLEEIRRELTLLYINRGYINSGVVIPNQDVANGIVRMHAVEGTVTDVEVTGTEHFEPEYFQARLKRGLAVPFNVADMEREQQILLQDPLLRRLNIELQPGLVPGEAKVHAEVQENSPYGVVLQIANNQSPTVGEVRGQMQGTVANLWGVGDILTAQYGRSQGINDGAIAYSLPILSDDTRVNVRYDINGTVVVTPALSALNVTSTYNSLAVGISRPFFRTAEQNLTFGANLEKREAQSFLLGLPFSFVAGAVNGKSNVTALRLYQDYLDRDAEHAFALRTTLSLGLHALGSTLLTDSGPVPTSKFTSVLFQTQYLRRVYKDWDALFRSDLQLTNHPLFPIEQFALGGIDTVRGYREFLTVTDDAFFASAELRIPVAKLRLPYLADSEEAGAVQLAPFYDFGRAWNIGRPTPYPPEISSIGLGARWLVGSGILAEVYYAKGLRHVRAGTSLEDRGIYFRLTAKVY